MSEQGMEKQSSSIFLDVLKYTSLPVYTLSQCLEHPDETAVVLDTAMKVTNPLYLAVSAFNSDKTEESAPKDKLKTNIKKMANILCPITNLFS